MFEKSLMIAFIILCEIGILASGYISSKDAIDSNGIAENINNEIQSEANDMSNNTNINDDIKSSVSKINLTVNNETFTATLEDSKTTSEFLNLLPLEVKMNELNGNEKYFYLDENLTTNSSSYRTIENGDIMLFGSNCLVLFYETHSSSYSYTRLGKVDDPSRLKEVLGSGNPTVRFEIID